MAKSKVLLFNVKNLKYATKTLGVYGTPVDLAYAKQVTLEADYSETTIYGDGEKLAVIPNDKGKKGSIIVTAIDSVYEIACGRAMTISGGLAEIEQLGSVEHAIYFEVDAVDEGVAKTYKNWLFNCTTGKATETYSQNEDEATINPYEYPLTVLGTNLRNTGDTADYVDTNGRTVKVFRLTSKPTDSGYDTFGATVPTPKQAA